MKSATEIQTANERLFPTGKSQLIFWAYIALFVSQGLLTQKIQRTNIYGFNTPIIVLLAEVVKLVICTSVYLTRSRGSWSALLEDFKLNRKLLALYIVPASLYCLYNNLTFVNQRSFDVTTYICLMQFRIVVTAIIYQFLFNRQLNLVQWCSLIILTAGCFIKQYGFLDNKSSHDHEISSTPAIGAPQLNLTQWLLEGGADFKDYDDLAPVHREPEGESFALDLMRSTGLLVLQIFCACFASVYNEYLLKDLAVSRNSDVILQNIFMYIDSIICNLIFYYIPTSYNDLPNGMGTLTAVENLLTNRLALILIVNSALAGLVSSLFLKNLNSILKSFASAIELIAIAFLAWILFRDPLNSYTIIALVFVSLAIVIYSNNPVSVAPPDKEPQIENREGFVRVPMSDS